MTPAEAGRNLHLLTECRCQPPWTERGLHEVHCVADHREDVDLILATMAWLREELKRCEERT